jgi:hypothetical protein
MKIFLLTALLSISFINVASTINQTPDVYKLEVNVWEHKTVAKNTRIEFGQDNITHKAQLHIAPSESAIDEDGNKVLAHLKNIKKTPYLSSEYLNRHWIYNFLPFEPDATTYTSTLETGSEYFATLTDEGKLSVTMTEISLDNMNQFMTESFTVIEYPDTNTFSTNALLSFPSNGEESCRTKNVSEENLDRKIKFCVTKI